MDDQHYSGNGDIDEVGRLIRYAGERETADSARFANAHARVVAHWETVIAERRRRRTKLRPFAVAAGIIAAFGVAFLLWQTTATNGNGNIATAARVIGDVRLAGEALRTGDEIGIGADIQTSADGLVALDLPDGQSLRLDHSSQLSVAAASHFKLDVGNVYVDSGAGPHMSSVTIDTPLGAATDVGTQFLVMVTADSLSVGVREGLVEVVQPGADAVAIDAGNLLELPVDGVPRRRTLAAGDTLWHWVSSITPLYAIEGKTLADYLSWYARQRGVALEWQEAESWASAKRTRLSGSISDLSLDDGFREVQRIAPFEFELTATTLIVRVR